MRVAEASSAGRVQAVAAAGIADHPEIQPAELRLRHLRTPDEIARIEPLRRQIQLPADVSSAPGFAALEKKGMRSESSRL